MNATTSTGQTRHGIVLIAAAIMPIMAIVSLVPVLPLLLQEFAATPGSAFLVPMALTIPALCVALFSPVAGWLADKVGRKALLVSTLLLYAACGILPWFLDALVPIIATRVGLGLAEAVIMTTATTLVGDYFKGAARERWIAIQVAAGSIAAIVLVALGGGLAELLGSRGPFLLYLVAVPIALAAALVLFEPMAERAPAGASQVRFPARRVLPLVGIMVFVGLIFYTVTVLMGEILGLSGPVQPVVIGLIAAGGNMGVMAGSLLFKFFGRLVGPMLLKAGFALAAVGYIGLSQSGSLPLLSIFAIIASIGSGLLLPNMLTWVMQALPGEHRGRGMGMVTGAFFLGQFVAPILAIAVTGASGGLANTLLIYGGIIALAAVAVQLGWRTSPEIVAP